MFKNIDHGLFKRLIIPGIIGSIIGAYFLTCIPTQIIKPWIAMYLLSMGGFILFRAFRYRLSPPHHHLGHNILIPLGLTGGFLDAAGGGGWGATVTSSLVALGVHPRYAVGPANLSEFLVTLASSATFIITVSITNWSIILGLLTGGIIAAPLTGFIVQTIPAKPFMLFVGILIILMSIRTILGTFL